MTAALVHLFAVCFFFNDTATTEIYTLSLHDALPIYVKYLTLINCITLLHQYQRPTRGESGYIYLEVTLKDIEVANKITQEVIGRSLDEQIGRAHV